MAEALGGFTAARHWDQDDKCCDWYCAPKGTPIGWLEPGTVYALTLVGPEGADDPLEVAYHVGESGWITSFCHVRNIAGGWHDAWDAFAEVSDSGIGHLPGEPAHIHWAAAYGTWPRLGPDGPTGTVPALWLLQQMGFGIEVVDRIPSPQDYLAGTARAGRFV